MEADPNLDRDLFVSLDEDIGPAPPLPGQRAESMARTVVRRARGDRMGHLRLAMQLVAGVALGLALGGGAMAAVTYFSERDAELITTGTQSDNPSEPPRARTGSTSSGAAAVEEKNTSAQPTAGAAAQPKANEAPAEAPAEASTLKPRPIAAAELLERANRLRAAGEYRSAERLYSRAMRSANSADDVYVATVAAAGLRLEHTGAPRGALTLYRRALRMRPDGPLSASIRHGIAECHRAQGQAAAEAAALQDFLERHPRHLLQQRVKSRLQELRALGH